MKKTNKAIVVLLVFALILQFAAGIIPTAAYAQTVESPLAGDLDGNGIVNTVDCDVLQDVLSGKREYTALADVDENNIVEKYDLTALQAICEGKALADGDLLDLVEQQELMQSLYTIGNSHRALRYYAEASKTKKLTLRFAQMQNWSQAKGISYDILSFVAEGDNAGYTLQLADRTGKVSNALSFNMTPGWTQISFPLSQIRNVELQEVTELIFAFSAQSELNVYIDQLQTSNAVFAPVPEATYIVENGISNYKILIPGNSSSYEQKASLHLQEFIKNATGATMEIATQAVSGEKYISLGNTALLMEQIPDVDVSALGARGFQIQTVNDNVFVFAKSDFGVYLGASCLLYKTVDYACYGVDAYTYSQKTYVPLEQYNITEIPDIEYNIAMSGYLSDEATRDALGYHTTSIFQGGNHNGIHSSFDIVPKSEYEAAHPKFYSKYSGTQLCYTAQGNATEYEALQNVFFTYIQGLLKQNTGNEPMIVGVTVEDNVDHCSCSTCRSFERQYGGYSATVLRFCNDLAERVYAWFETPEGSAYICELDIMFFAYHAYEDAPAQWNESAGKYEPIDASVAAHEHVIPLLAPIKAEHAYPLNDDKNADARENIKKWSAISEKTILWGYSTSFHNYFIPFNWMNSVGETIKFMKQYGYDGVLMQQEYNNISGGFNALQDYLIAKLSWDASLDQEQIIDEFFAGYYGPAGNTMREMFDTLCAVFDYQQNTLGQEHDIWADTPTAQCWPKDELLAMLALGEQALASLEGCEPQMYDRYVRRVKLEMLDIQYLLIELYGGDYTAEDLVAMKLSFRADCEQLNIRRAKELSNTCGAVYERWNLTHYPVLAHSTDTGSIYEKDEEETWYNQTVLASSEWTSRVEFGNRDNMSNTFGGAYTSLEAVIRLQEDYQGTLMAMVNGNYYLLSNANIQVYDAVFQMPITVPETGALPTGKWLRIVIDVAGILNVDAITPQNCYRIALTHKNSDGVMCVARVLAINPSTYTPTALDWIKQPTCWNMTSILGDTGVDANGVKFSTYEKDDVFGWYNHTTSGSSANEWNNRLELANVSHTVGLGTTYTTAEFVVYLEHNNNYQMKVLAGSDNPYHALNSTGITVYDAISGEAIAVSEDGKVPTGKWLRIVADLKILLNTNAITTSNCRRIGLTHINGIGVASVRIAQALMINPETYVYEVPPVLQSASVDITGILGEVGTDANGAKYSSYEKQKVGWYNHITNGTSANEWNNRLELANTAHTYALGSTYTTAEFVVYLETTNNYQLKVVAGSSNIYHALNSTGITVYDAISGETVAVGADGKVPTGKWLRIVADLKILLNTNTITTSNCYRIGLTHTAGTGYASVFVARVLVADPSRYVYKAPEAVYVVSDYLDFTSVLGKTDTGGQYLLDASNKYYNYTATSDNEWLNRLEFANAAQTAQMGEKYTHVEFVVQLPEKYTARLQVYVSSQYYYLNNENIKVYDAATGEEISVGSDGAVPTGKWLRIVADIKGLLGAPITAQNCWRIALTHKGNSTTIVTKVARVLAVNPLNYVYEVPEAVYVLPDYLDFTSVLGKTDTAGQYSLDESNEYYNYTAMSGNEWLTRVEFANATQTALMGEKYSHVEFVVQLPEQYAARLQVYVSSQYYYLNNENIKVYDAATGEEISVESDGKVPTGKWLRIVADIEGLLGAPITAQNCWRIALTHKGNSTTTVTKVAQVLAVDPLNYEYEAPETVYVVSDYLDFTSVLGSTDTAGQYSLDESNEYYNYTAMSGNEWLTRVEFANATQAAQMGEKYTHVEFVVQLPEQYAARLQVYVSSKYYYLNNENIKVYDAATGEEISVESDGAVPTGKWLRIVADIEGILGAPITAQNCWRIALTHKGNSTTTVTKVAHVYAIDPTNYTYVKPEAVK